MTDAITPRNDAAPRRSPPAFMNRLITALLRSPLHGLLSSMMMLVTFTGRKSGKRFTTPVSQIRSGSRLLFFTSNGWWRNLRGGAPITVRIKGRDQQATAEPVEDPEVVLRETKTFFASKGVRNARMIGLSLGANREPTDEELREALRGRVVVYVNL